MATETITVTFQIAACCAEGLITKLSVQMLTMSSLDQSGTILYSRKRANKPSIVYTCITNNVHNIT